MWYFPSGGAKSVADIDRGAKILTFRQIHSAIITLSALEGGQTPLPTSMGGPWPDLPAWIRHWGRPKYWERKRVAITDESIGISQLLGARARAVPTPKVYTYGEVKSYGNLTLQLYSIPSYHGGMKQKFSS